MFVIWRLSTLNSHHYSLLFLSCVLYVLTYCSQQFNWYFFFFQSYLCNIKTKFLIIFLISSKNIVEIACRVLEEPILSSLFLMEDQSGGIGILLKSTKKYFPFMALPYLQLLKSLCTDADSDDIVSLKIFQFYKF